MGAAYLLSILVGKGRQLTSLFLFVPLITLFVVGHQLLCFFSLSFIWPSYPVRSPRSQPSTEPLRNILGPGSHQTSCNGSPSIWTAFSCQWLFLFGSSFSASLLMPDTRAQIPCVVQNGTRCFSSVPLAKGLKALQPVLCCWSCYVLCRLVSEGSIRQFLLFDYFWVVFPIKSVQLIELPVEELLTVNKISEFVGEQLRSTINERKPVS